MFLLIQIKAILVALFLSVFVLTPTCLVALLFPLKWRLRIISPGWKIFSAGVMRWAVHSKVDIIEDHRSDTFQQVPCPGLYIANHQSFIDIPLMALVHQVPPIMKQEVLYIPIVGLLAWASGAMPVSRSKNNSRKKVFSEARKRLVRKNIGVQVYPEGTRSLNGEPKPYSQIRRTLLLFAYNEKVSVVPVSLYGSRGVLSKKGRIRTGRHLGIIVHHEIDPKEFTNADEFCQACWQKVIEGHDQMKAKLGPLNKNLSLA
jgi:1-acyl-sn-glycerol-3-phosphate acyltransferase